MAFLEQRIKMYEKMLDNNRQRILDIEQRIEHYTRTGLHTGYWESQLDRAAFFHIKWNTKLEKMQTQ